MARILPVIAALAIFKAPLFFALSGLVGFQYAGAQESPVYVGYVAVLFGFTILAYLYTCLKQPAITKTEAVFYAYAAFMLLNHALWMLLDPGSTKPAPDNLVFFVAFGVPAILAVRILVARNAWTQFIQVTELVTMIMAVGIQAAVVAPFLGGATDEETLLSGISMLGGASTQAASYFGALTFGLLGFYVFRAEPELRFAAFNSRVVNVFNSVLMVGLVIATILNGGRGAFLLLLAYGLMIFYWIATKRGMTYRGALRLLLVVAAIPWICYAAYQALLGNPFLEAGFRRAVAFVSVGGASGVIDLAEGGSGRDVFYGRAIAGIVDSPLLGHGAFGHWDRVTQPHNAFLDLALQFGIPVAVMLLFSLSVWLWVHRRPWNSYKCFMIVIGLYPSVSLMFSGGYVMEPIFWMALIGFLMVDRRPVSSGSAV